MLPERPYTIRGVEPRMDRVMLIRFQKDTSPDEHKQNHQQEECNVFHFPSSF